MTVQRVIPFPWLGKLVLVDQWKGVFAIVEVDKAGELAFSRREPVLMSGHLPAFPLAKTPWMVAATPFRGDNDMSSFGVFLLNPFTGETCAHVPVEQPIHTIIQTGDRGFCICFKDGSLLPLAVRFPSSKSGA